MPRYVFVSAGLGIIYADTADDPSAERNTPLDTLRQVDANIGETTLRYSEVPRGSHEASIDAYRADGPIRRLDQDGTYVASYRVEME